jgi:hypothetical protein
MRWEAGLQNAHGERTSWSALPFDGQGGCSQLLDTTLEFSRLRSRGLQVSSAFHPALHQTVELGPTWPLEPQSIRRGLDLQPPRLPDLETLRVQLRTHQIT